MPGRHAVFLVFAVAYFLSYFYRSANAVIAEELSRDLGLGPAELGLMTSLFFLAFAAAQLPLGGALDRWGARFVTPALMLAAVAGSVLFGLAHSFGVLAAGRALIGLGMAGILMGALKAFSGWFPPRQFATVSGIFLGLGSLGALAAATPLAALSQAYGWRSVFTGGALLVLLAAAAIAAVGRPAPGSAVSAGPPRGSLAEVFRSGAFWRLGFLALAVTGSMFAFQGLWAGPYLTERMGLPPLAAGNLLLLLGLGVSAGYLAVGWLADRLGLARVAAAGAAGLLLVVLILAFLQPGTPGWLLALLFALFGLGGSFSVLFFAQARALFPAHMTGRAVTAVNLLGIGGSALLQWLLGLVIGLYPQASGSYPPEAYRTALLLLAALLAAATTAYLPLLRDGGRGEPAGG